MKKCGEEWRAIHGWPYEVSSEGQIRRIGSTVVRRQTVRGPGYPTIDLWVGNRKKQFLVHRLVAEAFFGPCPEGNEVNHKDGDKLNASACNLEYVTRSENMAHAVALGLNGGPPEIRGEDVWTAVLTEADVREIRGRHTAGETYPALASEFGVSKTHIGRICRHQSWSHV